MPVCRIYPRAVSGNEMQRETIFEASVICTLYFIAASCVMFTLKFLGVHSTYVVVAVVVVVVLTLTDRHYTMQSVIATGSDNSAVEEISR